MIPGVQNERPFLLSALTLLAGTLAFAVSRLLRFLQQIRRDHHALQRTRDVMSDVAQDLSEVFTTGKMVAADRIMEQILYSAQHTTGAAAGALFLAGDDGILQGKAVAGLFPPPAPADAFFPDQSPSLTRATREAIMAMAIAPGDGVLGSVARESKAVLIPDARNDPRLPHYEHRDLAVRSFLAVPMRFQNRVMGVMAVVNPVDREPFRREEQETLQVLADQASLSVFYANLRESLDEKLRLDQEMRTAQRIQDSLQARDLPKVPGMDIAAITDAAMEVGGDYVDVFRVDADRVGLVVGDISGKGVGGAIFMAILRTMMRARAVGVPRPSTVLREVNRMLLEDMRRERFATLVYMVLDHRRRELRLSRAGHEAVLLRRGGQRDFEPFGSEGPGLGLLDEAEYDKVVPEDVLPLDEGDTVVVYTDGMVEAMDESGEEWGLARFQAALQAACRRQPDLAEALKDVRDQLLRFAGNMAEYDDYTLLAARVSPRGAPAGDGGAPHA